VHHPEFTMLEWYSTGQDYLDSLGLQEAYCEYMREKLGVARTVSVNGTPVDLSPPFRRLAMREAFAELAGINLDALREFGALQEAAADTGVISAVSDDWESLFHRLFLEKVEPLLPRDKPLFLTAYPAAIPTLAKTADGMYAERWELFIGGIEIANCYTEERDPQRLGDFFREEEARGATLPFAVPADRELVSIMADKLPACSGNALGIDRLLMVLLQKDSITEVSPFAWNKE
jgi:lysyl-tRNA synthetase class 2